VTRHRGPRAPEPKLPSSLTSQLLDWRRCQASGDATAPGDAWRCATLKVGFLGWDTAGWCHAWPVPGQFTTPQVSAPGAAPILLVGNTGDPATPYEGARNMADALGKGVGVEPTWKGEGHGAYGNGSDCVDSTVNACLLKGTVPQDGKVCS
jgi:hypothetical protein